MTDREWRALIITLVLGIGIFGVGATALFFWFRGFGDASTAGRPPHMGIIAALIMFVFAACVLLFVLAYRG